MNEFINFVLASLLLTLNRFHKLLCFAGQAFRVLKIDFSKAFDRLSHELLFAELNAYGFYLKALKLINDYIFQKNQRTKTNKSYNSWDQIVFVIPQVSLLGSILFSIFLSDLFLIYITANTKTS